jgi:hypothetical protein
MMRLHNFRNLYNYPHRVSFGAKKLILYDSYTDTDSTLIENHTPDYNPNSVSYSQASGHIVINSNHATMDTTGNLSWELDPGILNYRIDAWIHTGDTTGVHGAGFQLHNVDVDNYYWLMFLPTAMRIYTRYSGSFTLVTELITTFDADTDYFMRAISYNDTLTFRVGDNIIKYTASPLPLKSTTQISYQVRTAATATSFTYFDRTKIYQL